MGGLSVHLLLLSTKSEKYIINIRLPSIRQTVMHTEKRYISAEKEYTGRLLMLPSLSFNGALTADFPRRQPYTASHPSLMTGRSSIVNRLWSKTVIHPNHCSSVFFPL